MSDTGNKNSETCLVYVQHTQDKMYFMFTLMKEVIEDLAGGSILTITILRSFLLKTKIYLS